MIDHFNLPVANLDRSSRFYGDVLAVLGYPFLMRDGEAIGFGVDAWRFGIVAITSPIPPLHLAFEAESREQVDRLFEAALAAGGRSLGPPGIRPHYDANYYAAYVADPDGHNVEAVFVRYRVRSGPLTRPLRQRSLGWSGCRAR